MWRTCCLNSTDHHHYHRRHENVSTDQAMGYEDDDDGKRRRRAILIGACFSTLFISLPIQTSAKGLRSSSSAVGTCISIIAYCLSYLVTGEDEPEVLILYPFTLFFLPSEQSFHPSVPQDETQSSSVFLSSLLPPDYLFLPFLILPFCCLFSTDFFFLLLKNGYNHHPLSFFSFDSNVFLVVFQEAK